MQLGNVRDVSALCDGWKLQAADASEHLEGVTLVEQSRTNLGGCFMCSLCRAGIHNHEQGPY